MLQIFSMSQTFSMFFEKSRQKRQSPNIFLCVLKHLCSKKHKQNVGTLSFLPWFFNKNIKKIWDIEKICNIVKFRKNQCYLKFLDGHTLWVFFSTIMIFTMFVDFLGCKRFLEQNQRILRPDLNLLFFNFETQQIANVLWHLLYQHAFFHTYSEN